MCYINILETEPCKVYMKCQIKTDLNRELIAEYYEEYGIFFLNDEDKWEIGWKDNGENNELVTHWKEIK